MHHRTSAAALKDRCNISTTVGSSQRSANNAVSAPDATRMAEAAPHRIAGRRPGDEKHDEPATDGKPLIGVLALQGSVEEHIDVLHKLGAATREIRVKEEVAGVDGLIFPGGESTAMATFQCTNQFRGDSCDIGSRVTG